MGKTLRLPVSFVIAALVLAFFAVGPHKLSATDTNSITGWGWSDTIGWISFNCLDLGSCSTVNYGLSIDTNGNISGYAWSENIGWISANSSDLSGCPSNPCTAKLTGNKLRGWLKALAASGSGWDGWVSLSGSNPSYGPELSGNTFSGYAWGSDVVGWIDFSLARNSVSPSCSVSFDNNPIMLGGGTTLRWSSSNATSMTINTIGAVTPNVSGSTWVQPSATTDYSCTALGDFGMSGSFPASLAVQCADTYICSGQTIRHTNSSCTTSDVTTCVSPNFCSDGSAVCLTPPPAYQSEGQLRAAPQVVYKGNTTRIFWDVSNVASCTVTGSNGDSWAGVSASSANCTHQGSTNNCVSGAINEQTTYTLHCIGYDGSVPPDLTASVVVSLIPVFEER